jgi:hypothetical protein
MTNVITLKTKSTIDRMVDQIHREFAAATADTKRADRARIRAGKLLIELRKRVEAGEVGEGVNWWEWYDENFARTKRDARKCIKIARAADPELAAEDERERNRNAKAKQRRSEVRPQLEIEDLVFAALCLVEKMNHNERQKFFAELRSIYAYQHENRRNG